MYQGKQETGGSMSTMTNEDADLASYPAPNGWSDFHKIAEQLHEEHPRNMMTGAWRLVETGRRPPH